MYRGQDIGSRNELIDRCVAVLEDGETKALFSILPHITLTRDRSFCPRLIELLEHGSTSQQIFAAMALGSLSCEKSVPPLRRALARPGTFQGNGTQSLQQALIFALGESGQESAVSTLMELSMLRIQRDTFRKRRLDLIITAVGTLAQSDVPTASETLFRLIHSESPRIRARAIAELEVASWHLGTRIPVPWIESFRDALLDPDEGVQFAAWSALENLADLGCGPAVELVEWMMEAVPA